MEGAAYPPSVLPGFFAVSMHVCHAQPPPLLTWLQPKRSECGTLSDARDAIGYEEGAQKCEQTFPDFLLLDKIHQNATILEKSQKC